jgi:hypothetical protein
MQSKTLVWPGSIGLGGSDALDQHNIAQKIQQALK